MMTTEANKKKTIKITMSERRPLTIVADEWPLIARVDRHDGQVECQANHEWTIRVRESIDGMRRIVYGWLRAGNGGVHAGWRGSEGGFLLSRTEHEADAMEAETVRAIRRVGGIIDDDKMSDECIADLPTERLYDVHAHGVPTDNLALLLALLVQARPHCPPDLQEEIVAAISAGRE